MTKKLSKTALINNLNYYSNNDKLPLEDIKINENYSSLNFINEGLLTNCLGQEIKNPENFRKWFGNSITVDKQGRPLVFYHGTRTDFTEFKTGYSDNLIFFSYEKKFADDWGKSKKGYSNELSNEIFDKLRVFQNNLFKEYQAKYGEEFYTENEEMYKQYHKEVDEYEEQLEKERNVHNRTLGCYLKVHKIFVPERDYELVLDEICEYYKFTNPYTPEYENKLKEFADKYDAASKHWEEWWANNKDTKEEVIRAEEKKLDFAFKEYSVYKSLKNSFENHLDRIKKGAWIYFEHGNVINKIWSLGYDAIQLSEANGEQTTIAVRAGNNQIKSIDNNGSWSTSDNIYEKLSNGLGCKYLSLSTINEKLENIDRTTVVINREDELVNYLKSKQKSQRIIYDSKKDWYLVSSNDMLTHDNIVLQAYNMGYYGDIPITSYIKEGMNRVKGNKQDPKYLYSFYYSPQEILYKNFFDGIDHGYIFKNFGSIYTKGFEIEKILDLGVPIEMKENINSIYRKINQMYEKLTSFKIVPRKNILFDDMEDETGINVIEDNLEECMSSAQLGTAPTPAVNMVQAKVNGTPVEGKSIKKKKKIKDIVEELNNIIRPWEDDAASPKYVFRNAVDPEIEFEDALDLIIYGQDEDEKEEYQEYLNFFKDTGRLNDYLNYCKEKGYDRVDVSIESFGLREDVQELSPEDIMDMVEETFNPSDILTTTIKNSRDIIRVSVYYTHPEDRVLTHSIKLEYLDIDEETVIDEVIEEDLSVGDCLEELHYIFKTHKPLTEDQNTDQVVIEWLDKLNFISTNARTGFNYYYEGNYTHVITYDRSKIRYMIISDNKPIYDKSWNINSFEDVNTAFKEIEKELDSYE